MTKYLREYKIFSEWDYDKNGDLDPQNITHGSSRKVWWTCKQNSIHKWRATVKNRTKDVRPTGCPLCSGHNVSEKNNLFDLYTDLCKEWDYKRNKILPQKISFGSHNKVYWICSTNPKHIWKMSPNARTNCNYGCPLCSGQTINNLNCLLSTHPTLCEEWDYNKNNISPKQVSYGSNKKVWWKCKYDHSWSSAISDRTRKDSRKINCIHCNITNGEKLIQEYLVQKGIPFVYQINLDKKRYDFGCMKQIKWCIEYDGIQHFESIEYFGGDTRLKIQKINDAKKNEYCKNNYISLLRISYKEMHNIIYWLDLFFQKINLEYVALNSNKVLYSTPS